MQTCPAQTEILLGKGMPHEIGKLSFSQVRVKYQSLSLGAFHCFIVWLSLLSTHPYPPHSPKVFKWKSFLSKVFTQRRHWAADEMSSGPEHLSVL